MLPLLLLLSPPAAPLFYLPQSLFPAAPLFFQHLLTCLHHFLTHQQLLAPHLLPLQLLALSLLRLLLFVLSLLHLLLLLLLLLFLLLIKGTLSPPLSK